MSKQIGVSPEEGGSPSERWSSTVMIGRELVLEVEEGFPLLSEWGVPLFPCNYDGLLGVSLSVSKLRISLGLKPLQVDDASKDGEEKTEGEERLLCV